MKHQESPGDRHMESALTPREIQARIRGGESLADVAQAAGVPVEHIEPFAGPVLAEREHATLQARGAQVRRRKESSSPRTLGDTVEDALAKARVESDQISWDAWRDENRHWTVRATWAVDATLHHADFDFDPRGRYSVARNAEARSIIGDRPPTPVRTADPDAEPTVDLHDELAIVRVVQDETEPPAVVPDVPAARIIKLPSHSQNPADDEHEPDDYTPAELEKVDGVYDIVPNPHSDMDVLYDMLAGFNEDSVRIYTGLTQPIATQPDPQQQAPETRQEAPGPAKRTRTRRNRPDKQESLPAEAAAAPHPSPDAAQPPAGDTEHKAQDDNKPDDHEQGPRKHRKRRASVPSWDEIMFGGPQPPD
ncbi:septation protein SepH [Brooklawnia cerclae]|nr:septation protein SepH [Brooklawnia cerclae]